MGRPLLVFNDFFSTLSTHEIISGVHAPHGSPHLATVPDPEPLTRASMRAGDKGKQWRGNWELEWTVKGGLRGKGGMGERGVMGRIIDVHSSSEQGKGGEEESGAVVDLTHHIHQLPCCIKHNGPSDVSHYFKPHKTGVETPQGLSVEEAYFRGRRLQGAEIPLPQGYHGFILGKKRNSGKRKAKEISQENTNTWERHATFKSVTYWNHDTPPSDTDAFQRCFHWFSLANALHKPVTADDLVHASAIPR